jgi:Ca2+-binding EF-hand superfamily protein
MGYVLTAREERLALAVFEALDNDNDGFLTKDDFSSTCSTSDNNMNTLQKHSIQDLFEQFDVNNDGSITKTEFLISCGQLVTSTIDKLKENNGNNDGSNNDEDGNEEYYTEKGKNYLKETLINFTTELSNSMLNGSLPPPLPPNRTDSAVLLPINDDGFVPKLDLSTSTSKTSNKRRLPKRGEIVEYCKPGISPCKAIILGVHPFSKLDDPLYTIKIVETGIEFETFSYFLNYDDRYIPINENTTVATTTATTDYNNNDNNSNQDDDNDIMMEDATNDDDYTSPSYFLPEYTNTHQEPPQFIINEACREIIFELYRLLIQFSKNELFYPHSFVTSKLYQPLEGFTDSLVVQYLNTFKAPSKAAVSVSFQQLLQEMLKLGQSFTNKQFALNNSYYPNNKRVPERNKHIVALANVSVISHITELKNSVLLGNAAGNSGNSGTSGNSTTTTTTNDDDDSDDNSNEPIVTFQMDNQTEKNIRHLFNILDKDSDGEINWVKDFVNRSTYRRHGKVPQEIFYFTFLFFFGF